MKPRSTKFDFFTPVFTLRERAFMKKHAIWYQPEKVLFYRYSGYHLVTGTSLKDMHV